MPSLLQYFARMQFPVIMGTIYNIRDSSNTAGKIHRGSNSQRSTHCHNIMPNRSIIPAGYFMPWEKAHGKIMLEGREHLLVRGESLSRLEEIAIRDSMPAVRDTAPIEPLEAYAKLVGINVQLHSIHDPAIISSLLPESFMADKGNIYCLKPGKGELATDAGNFSIGSKATSIEAIAPAYCSAIRAYCGSSSYRHIGSSVLSGQRHYSQSRNIGFEIINESFYLYTLVKPYILYERLNGCYYHFPQARVATRLTGNGSSIIWEPLVVMEPYSHPSLPYTGQPMQKICTGTFSYNGIKRRCNSTQEELAELMHFAGKVLTECYFSAGRPYSFLADRKYNSMRTNAPDMRMVTNV